MIRPSCIVMKYYKHTFLSDIPCCLPIFFHNVIVQEGLVLQDYILGALHQVILVCLEFSLFIYLSIYLRPPLAEMLFIVIF